MNLFITNKKKPLVETKGYVRFTGFGKLSTNQPFKQKIGK